MANKGKQDLILNDPVLCLLACPFSLMENKQKEIIREHGARLLVFCILGFMLYSNVLQGEFISDDYTYIAENFAIRDLGNLKALWQSFSTRFLVGLTFALQYAWARLDVTSYHVVNVLLHIICSYLVFIFWRLTLHTPFFQESPLQKDSQRIALFAGLIFLSHPIQTQAVSYIMQRSTIMATMFYILTLIFYIQARLQNRKEYSRAAIGSFFLGIFCKEMIITVPLMIFIYECYFLGFSHKDWKATLRNLLPFMFLSGILLIVFLNDTPASTFGLKEQMTSSHFSWRYFLTEINVLRTYLRLLILPINQNHNYAYSLAGSFLEPWTLYSFFLLAGLFGLAVHLFKKYRLLSFAIVWFFITTSVEFTIVCFVQRGVIYEHWLYLSMVGFSVGLAGLFYHLLRRAATVKMTVYCLVVVVLGAMTFLRNFVWQDEIRFWEDIVRKSGRSPIVYLGMGTAYQRKGFDQRALESFERGLQLFKVGGQGLREVDQIYLSRIYNNIGLLNLNGGKTKEAILAFQRSYQTHLLNEAPYHNLAKICIDLKQYQRAIFFLKEAWARNPQDPEIYYGLGLAYLGLRESDKAMVFFQKAYQLEKSYGNQERVDKLLRLLKSIENQAGN